MSALRSRSRSRRPESPARELSNTTADGTADEDIAWDAIAFQTLHGKPKHVIVTLGDSYSYSSGEGAGSYSPESNTSHGTSVGQTLGAIGYTGIQEWLPAVVVRRRSRSGPTVSRPAAA
ncbi:hypothetical protein [Streptomyces gardneri]|uniref:hypothetical protein n=1 Tax=Streptomyces gardneri TaxID=66892 RepID=UPI0037CFFFFD